MSFDNQYVYTIFSGINRVWLGSNETKPEMINWLMTQTRYRLVDLTVEIRMAGHVDDNKEYHDKERADLFLSAGGVF